ncbi:MAG: hypothetical protein WCY83_03535, partial [Bacteroidales bacterium]
LKWSGRYGCVFRFVWRWELAGTGWRLMDDDGTGDRHHFSWWGCQSDGTAKTVYSMERKIAD